MEDEAAVAVEEKELAQWAESAGEASSASTGAPLIEDEVDESSVEEVEAVKPQPRGEGVSCGGPALVSQSGPAGPHNHNNLRRCPCDKRGPRRRGRR